jgi:uncharacterized damage-inducible protein DinB
MRRIALGALCVLACQLVSAQEGSKTVVNELVKHWETSKTFSLAVANAMPDDAYSFKATPAERSFGGQMNHLASGNAFYCSTAIGSTNPMGKPADDTKATVIKSLNTAYDYCIAGLKEMTDADLQKTASMRGTPVTKLELFLGGFTHAAHTRGQVEVYLRLKDITPPDYKF